MNVRKYGDSPYRIAVIHGGPGAAGEMAPVARFLSHHYGILEPMQTAVTIQGQIEELAEILVKETDTPVILIGYSWGAWLSAMVAARYPYKIHSLILVSAGPFEEQYSTVFQNRMNRLTPEEQREISDLIRSMNDPDCTEKDLVLKKFGEFMGKTDIFNPGPDLRRDSDMLSSNHEIFARIWDEAAKCRESGKLIEICKQIRCPVIAIHGDYDPHPAEGVNGPLSRVIPEFRFILLEHCGHCPWMEAEAKERFFAILIDELSGLVPSSL
ncbi:alpha/beta fold hydrolase [Methanospirillum stamsii]|uniref:Alpha/beta hydrolase n=1 Tax=Methanospirillum stamsii TaxID=1277351 RepID=A0A2V2N0I2_9EURY|nr:alpha/beta hydrolase [Methanospirillum stamsii]PWR71146.1 alpha/beta hydrolase [Methanospirillum stamsii]